MIQFDKPINLNGSELLAELSAAGIKVNEDNSPFIDGNGDFWLDLSDKDKTKAASIVTAHNGTIIAKEPTIAEKLKNAGLTLDELKDALGL